MFRSILLPLLFAVLLAIAAPAAHAADEVFVTDAGAIRGFDPVAYHLEHRPVPGLPTISAEWNGVSWRFASEANRARFLGDPQRYAPQYGGYCAYGTSRGYKVGTDPEAFAIVDGKLYLNYSKSVQLTWNLDRPGHIAAADRHWLTLEHSEYNADGK